ncbi:TonB-dependent receptor [Bacteroides sp.]|uniref:SusC/RagA family TonB-linked outer membrane protein n=1 Tax=Bacteroides sp. TaxID=29523 RepID=UPI0026187F7F|nr:TonB-dependent receptor [Bacteroides sp.]
MNNYLSKKKCSIFILLMIVSTFCIENLSAQNTKLKGEIFDDLGPVIGATIVIKSKPTVGTTTDVDGKFSINAQVGDILLVSFIGYEPKEVKITNTKTLRIKLEESANKLDEVTVVAFGKQKKENLLGSVTTVKPGELRAPSSNLTTALGGRIAGLISMQTSGEPGADNAQFFVRGVATFNEYSKGPLILIDNMELSTNDLARLAVDDIESFSIMKDATATALYGSRGANGVILVTTKEGRDGKTNLSFRFENSFSQATRDVEFADPLTYMKLNNEAIITRHPLYNRRYSDDQIAGVESGSDPYYYPANDWRKLLFKDMTTNQRFNMSLSGGGKKVRYYIAGALNNDTGVLKTDSRNNFNNNINIKNINIRSNTNINFTSTTEGSVKFNANFRSAHGPMYSGNQMYQRVMLANPVDFPAFYKPDDMNIHTQHILFGGTPEYSFINPYADMVKGYQESTQTNLVAQIELRQKLDFITKGLSARVMGSTTRESVYAINRFYDPYYYTMSTYNPTTGYFKLNNFHKGDEALGFTGGDKNVLSTIYGELSANYDREFNEKHAVSGMVVGTIREIVTSDFGDDLQRSLPTRNLGISGRFTYSYDHRYLLEANFGYNGAERFARHNQFGFFPSFGVGWIVTNEKFWKKNNILTNLKLKGTYGLVGNDAIGDAYDRFFYLSRISKDKGLNNDFGENPGSPTANSSGIKINRFANTAITWEKAAKLNLGFEATLFDELEIQFDYFKEKRTNILINRTAIPSTMGLTDVPVADGSAPADVRANVGAASSSGFEFTLDESHVFNKDIWMRSTMTFTYARSRYTKYEEIVPTGMDWLKNEGEFIGQQRGLIAERLFIDEADIANSPKQTFDNINDNPVMPGDIKYRDINNDGLINSHDFVPIGYSSVPQIEGGFGMSFGFYGFDFNFFLKGASKVSFMIDPTANVDWGSNTVGTAPFVGNHALLKAWADDHWSETNRNSYALWPRLSDTSRPNNEQPSTWWLRDGSYLRLKSVELGYTIPERITKKIAIQSFRVYVSGMNLLTWSKFKLWDVEMGGSGLNYPIQRVFNVGLNFNF